MNAYAGRNEWLKKQKYKNRVRGKISPVDARFGNSRAAAKGRGVFFVFM